MAEAVTIGVVGGISGIYQAFLNILPIWAQDFVNLFLLVALVLLYTIFIWNFYRFISKKNIISLNLNKYNHSQHPGFAKFLAGMFYFAEYIIILPFLIFFWFLFFTLFLIVLTETLAVGTLLIMSATIIAAIRMASYYNEDVAKELAKILPFTLLGISIINPNFFYFQRIINNLAEIPGFFQNIFNYLLFIVLIEIILRFFDFIFSLFGIHNQDEPPIEE
jgi:hypothetical protein